MEELSTILNQVVEQTKTSGNAIGEAMKIPWNEAKKHMTWYQIKRVETKCFFSRIWFKVLKKTKYRKLFAAIN
ncbi:hypothetical protein G9F71_008670 [Clostridium sp. FP2]|uniref:hypothetical protein n=1 Tax=Clostridium sp. FP2 TaxID=2724481 RepID=UPI0013E97BEB|nr:hypothetical protein [Clostridium sp. FP2]MBZ9622926.1 hypothetical protein [Clostridium sp. FP2]